MKKAQHGGGVWSNLGIVVWGVYGYLSGHREWLRAGFAGFAIVGIIIAMQFRRGAVKIMDCTSLSYFIAELILDLSGARWLIAQYHLVIVWGLFAAVAWSTLIAGFPFTLQYVREKTPRENWARPPFLRMNQRMTEVWAVIFTLGAVLGVVALEIGHTLMLGLVIPGVMMLFGYAFSVAYPKWFAKQFASGGADAVVSSCSIARPR